MSEHTLNPPTIKRLERSRTEKVFAGVCGGLGRYFDLTPAVFRLGFVALTLLGGAGILVYIAAALVMPKEGAERSVAEDILANRRDHPARLVALGLVAVAVLSLLARADTWPTAGTAWCLVALAALIFLWTGRRRGIAIALISVLALVLATAVAVVVAAFAWFNVSLDDGVGNRTYAPTATASTARYDLGIGKLTVDLSHHATTTPLHVHANLGIGELRVILPRDVSLVLSTHIKAGDRSVAWQGDTGGPFYVDATVGAGHIDVVRAG